MSFLIGKVSILVRKIKNPVGKAGIPTGLMNNYLRVSLKTVFQMFFAPPLKGETSENQPPFRERGNADFQ